MTEPQSLVVSPGRPAYPVRAKEAFGISPGDWRALVDAVWPSAKTTEAVELALSYCRARNLDPFKKPVHIVPIWSREKGGYVESVWPGIGELRTTAARTGQLAGFDEAEFGPEMTRTFKGTVSGKAIEKVVAFPEWCQVTVYRMVQGHRVAFRGPCVRWLETYSTLGASDIPNDMWESRPYGQLEKCTEAAALRRAFPEEVGNDMIPEEIGRREPIDITPEPPPAPGAKTAQLVERLRAGRQPDPVANVVATTQEAEQSEVVVEVERDPNIVRTELINDIKAALKATAPRGKSGETFLREFGVPFDQVAALTNEHLAEGLARLKQGQGAPNTTRSVATTIRQAAEAHGLSEEALLRICKGDPEEVPDDATVLEEILDKIRKETQS